MERSFQDIRIISLDVEKSHRQHAGVGLYELYLTLSATPPHQWKLIFEKEHKFARNSIWRLARVDGDFIVVSGPQSELEHHLQFLKEDVKNANEKFKASVIKDEESNKRFLQSQQEQKKELENLRDRLKFD